jgi:hypothetical protein
MPRTTTHWVIWDCRKAENSKSRRPHDSLCLASNDLLLFMFARRLTSCNFRTMRVNSRKVQRREVLECWEDPWLDSKSKNYAHRSNAFDSLYRSVYAFDAGFRIRMDQHVECFHWDDRRAFFKRDSSHVLKNLAHIEHLVILSPLYHISLILILGKWNCTHYDSHQQTYVGQPKWPSPSLPVDLRRKPPGISPARSMQTLMCICTGVWTHKAKIWVAPWINVLNRRLYLRKLSRFAQILHELFNNLISWRTDEISWSFQSGLKRFLEPFPWADPTPAQYAPVFRFFRLLLSGDMRVIDAESMWTSYFPKRHCRRASRFRSPVFLNYDWQCQAKTSLALDE